MINPCIKIDNVFSRIYDLFCIIKLIISQLNVCCLGMSVCRETGHTDVCMSEYMGVSSSEYMSVSTSEYMSVSISEIWVSACQNKCVSLCQNICVSLCQNI